MQAGYLAFAVGQYALGTPAVEAVLQLQVDGQHLIDAEALGDGADQKMRRGGDHQQAVASGAVRGQGAAGVAVEDRFDHVLDEGLDHMGDLLGRAADQRRQGEGHVVLHGQCAGGILAHQLLFVGDEGVAIGPANLHHFLCPQTGAVAMDQRFVEIENRQGHHATSRIASAPMARLTLWPSWCRSAAERLSTSTSSSTPRASTR